MTYTLVIGNHYYSSWSLRGWLYLRESGIDFKIIRLPLFTGEWQERIGHCSPTRRVPVLLDHSAADDVVTVWDSLAIMEYVREQCPGALGWPAASPARAEALSIVAEMHSGFLALRDELPQNIRMVRPIALTHFSDAAQLQIARVVDIWNGCRSRYRDQGPWLLGPMCIADIMYAPVAMRFVTYGVPLPAAAQEFVDAVMGLPSMQEWRSLAASEVETLDFIDDLVPANDSPLTFG